MARFENGGGGGGLSTDESETDEETESSSGGGSGSQRLDSGGGGSSGGSSSGGGSGSQRLDPGVLLGGGGGSSSGGGSSDGGSSGGGSSGGGSTGGGSGSQRVTSGGGTSTPSDQDIINTATEESAGDLGGIAPTGGGTDPPTADEIAQTAFERSAGNIGTRDTSGGGTATAGGSSSGGGSSNTTSLTEDERNQVAGQVIASNTELFTTGADDPDGGPLTREDIRVSRQANGEIGVSLTADARQRLSASEQSRQSSLDRELLLGASRSAQNRFETENALAFQNNMSDDAGGDIEDAIQATREQFITEQTIQQQQRADATQSPLEGAAQGFNEQSRRERDIALSTEQFGELDFSFGLGGPGDEVETFVDNTGDSISETLLQQGREAEAALDAEAERARGLDGAPGSEDLAGRFELAGEISQGVYSNFAGSAQAPSAGLNAAEAASFLLGGTNAAGGSVEETQDRLRTVGSVGANLAGEAARGARENPIDFGAELVTGAAIGGAAGSAARRLGALPDSRTSLLDSARGTRRQIGDAATDAPGDIAGSAADLEVGARNFFTGSDRAQGNLGNLLPESDSTRTLGGDDIADPGDLGTPRIGRDRTFEDGPADTPPGDRPNTGVQSRRRQAEIRSSGGEGSTPPRAAAARRRAERGLSQDVDVLDDATQSDFFPGGSLAVGGVASGALGRVQDAQASAVGAQAGAFAFGGVGNFAGMFDAEGTATGFENRTGGRGDTGIVTDLDVGGRARTGTESLIGTAVRTRPRTETRSSPVTRPRQDQPAPPGGFTGPDPGPPTPRFPDDDTDAFSVDGEGGSTRQESGGLLDGLAGPGFFAETTAAASGSALRGRTAAAGGGGSVAALTGEVPTDVQGSSETQSVTGILSPGGGGEIGGSFGFDLLGGGGGDSDTDGFGFDFDDDNSENGLSLF